MLYYNSRKLVLHSHTIAQSYIRDVDVYKLYYKSSDLAQGDTAFVICVVAHLKAGSDDQYKRNLMAQNTMSYLEDLNDDDNYLMMGDFNLYTSGEPAYQQFINYNNTNLRFNDPLNQAGDWHNNYDYRYVHTQSTHASSNGCASSGGMDDRFDFILISNSIKNGTKSVRYLSDSYWAVGQDGQHFNTSVNASPTNTSVPPDVLYALANNSDHLPVTLRLVVDKTLDISEQTGLLDNIVLVNPTNGDLDLRLWAKEPTTMKLGVYNILGEVIMQESIVLNKGENHITRSMPWLKPGMYIVRLSDKDSRAVVKKLLKY
jgi:endonuclease/exonuclease/phosphatase family metal-dependent hydrolase